MVIYIKRGCVERDTRMSKYIKACEKQNVKWEAITWDRLKKSKCFPNEHQYKKYAAYGQGWKNIVGLLGWAFFVWYYLIMRYRFYKVIHVSNLDSFLLAIPFKLFGKKIIFDIYDSINFKWERCLAPYAELLILPSEKRLELIGLDKSNLKAFLEIENLPAYSTKEFSMPNGFCELDKITLSYVGTFEKKLRGLENVIKLVKEDKRFILHLAGSGGGLDELVTASVKECDRIIYHGPVKYDEALTIMHNSDFIIGMYYTNPETGSPIHKYASPNKFHESLFLNRPIVTSEHTFMGERVKKLNTGYVIEDTYEALKDLFDKFGTKSFKEAYMEKVKNCKYIWDNKYKSYGRDVLEGTYVGFLKQYL